MGKDKGIVMDGRDIGTVVFLMLVKIVHDRKFKNQSATSFDELVEKGNISPLKTYFKNVEET